jgi:acetyl-CoA carboxylase, biotin carboxylase subunit
MKKVLVANRGEIACRIIRALKDLSIEAVAVYSEADKDALHVKLADSAICIGKSQAKDSYLNISRIIAACEIANVDGVHPGYGFLSENALFAQVVEQSGLVFIGPDSDLIRLLGDKIEAKKIARRANCPVIPGTDNALRSLEEGLLRASEIGYPLMIKASSGGGGKGIRIARSDAEFKRGFVSAKQEARLSFDDDALYLEKMIVNPKHIEVQVAADHHGNVIHLFERDCTLQKRRQKLIEETFSPSLNDSQRKKVCASAVSLMKEAKYNSVGTVEFLLDEDGRFYFMEVNTRIQVEHTITEELTGVDLIKLQIESAFGAKLGIDQKDVQAKGHVMEFRINAEDPERGFCPTPGLIELYIPPVGKDVRLESAIYQGLRISPFYDSMIAKLIVKGDSREDVINKSRRILREFYIKGVATTIPFFITILNDDIFIKNRHFISSVDEMITVGE